MLVGFAVDKAPRIKPGRRIVSASYRMLVGTRNDYGNEIILSHHGDDRGCQLVAVSSGLPAHDLGKEGDYPLQA